jgi:hypothetical protein
MKPVLPAAGLAVMFFSATACVVERTVTENGEVVFEGPVVEKPGHDLIQDTRETSSSGLLQLAEDEEE